MLSYSVTPYITQLSERKISEFPGICYECNFCTDGYSDSSVKNLLDENLPESLTGAVSKRKSEFVAGRYLARKALMALGANTTSVGIGAHREPLWPHSFIGSISHSKEFAVCAVANQNNVKRIGIDVENFIDVKVARDIVQNVLIESEYKLVGNFINPHPVLLTLIFSAKESLFKALYPEVGCYFDFHVAQTKIVNYQTGKFILELVQELAPALPIGTRFEGEFEIDLNKVITIIKCLN